MVIFAVSFPLGFVPMIEEFLNHWLSGLLRKKTINPSRSFAAVSWLGVDLP